MARLLLPTGLFMATCVGAAHAQDAVLWYDGNDSRDLPTTAGCFQPKHGGGRGGCFAAKLSADLKQLMWCTYLGGSGDESPRGGLALDADDNVCIFGTTGSDDFPATSGAQRRAVCGSERIDN